MFENISTSEYFRTVLTALERTDRSPCGVLDVEDRHIFLRRPGENLSVPQVSGQISLRRPDRFRRSGRCGLQRRRGVSRLAGGVAAAGRRRCFAPCRGSAAGSDSGLSPAPPMGHGGPRPPRRRWQRTLPHRHRNEPDGEKI